ncbi:MAG: enoyl-CoA hydratase/isomerase family protein [Chloroflexi bacterium]|nr:enoyl-CoA hydratase/isomerase family protein [Chloroflexota bacterium]
MDYSDIIYEVEDSAAVITLNRPARLNAWTGTMEREVRDALNRSDRDARVRGIIITGAGRGFCAGADMAMLNTIADAGGNEGRAIDPLASAPGLEANYHQAFSFPLATQKPLIAAVNGAAAGVGLILALYCDLRFASENGRFGTAFSPLGLIAEHGISWLLPRYVGTGNALDLLYSARVIDAPEALSMGLVQRVYPQDELLAASKAYIGSLERSSPKAMAVTKRLVYDAHFQDLATAVRSANDAMAERLKDPQFKEGLNAFAEKRAPQWAGLGE